MSFDRETLNRAAAVLDACRQRGWKIATAESCTGGLVAGALTAIAASSDVFERGFVTYSNDAKMELVGVPRAMLDRYGAVSEPIAQAMATGALAKSRADLAVAVTGIAGPGGGTLEKPVGLVCFGLAATNRPARTEAVRFPDTDRAAIREASVIHALDMLHEVASG